MNGQGLNPVIDPDLLLQLIKQHNQRHSRILLYYLADRGFFAEVTFLARVMVYAVRYNYRLIICNDDFLHKVARGWQDFFKPFCETYDPEIHLNIDRIVRFGDARLSKESRGQPLQHAIEILNHYPSELTIESHQLKGIRAINASFVRAIYRLNDRVAELSKDVIEALELPDTYDCVHIRRGDKVDDEDRFYPASEYFQKLDLSSSQSPVFVMTDDYGALAEAQTTLKTRELPNRIISLCEPRHRGFDIYDLRNQKPFFSHDGDSSEATGSMPEMIYQETVQLLTEVEIARASRKFVSTNRSNVFKLVAFTHRNPDACFGIS